MSNYSFNSDIEIYFNESESLHKAIYRPLKEELGVFYQSNTWAEYTHDNCDLAEFKDLLQTIDFYGSAGKGYAEWKNVRKLRLQKEDERIFQDFWNKLNKYQKKNLIDFVLKKRMELNTYIDPKDTIGVWWRGK